MTDEYTDKLPVISATSVQEITDRLEIFREAAWVNLWVLISL